MIIALQDKSETMNRHKVVPQISRKIGLGIETIDCRFEPCYDFRHFSPQRFISGRIIRQTFFSHHFDGFAILTYFFCVEVVLNSIRTF